MFNMIELGCACGCWMNNTAKTATRTRRNVHVAGIEGHEGHLEFAGEALARNGFSPDKYTVHRGVAAATAGSVLFPRQEHAGHNRGDSSRFCGATKEQ
ncbi:hypothetical protein [Burkholderia sp. RF4-BP95]|uniref:hypothetical protein n=1 Tax=Burkholderia sp. RF4-BP95 TaxID=1637845 RepID=UPI00211D61D4|nr:hypothetical protein [Burkholderia sp. RF4-BP95]